MEYSKKPTSICEQITLLKDRGMICSDENKVKTFLKNYGYYRLSAYSYIFKDIKSSKKESFIEGTNFVEILKLYKFDSDLRLLILKSIEFIEIKLRTSITYHFSRYKNDPFVHYNHNNFHKNFKHEAWLSETNSEVLRSKDQFIRHFKNKYDGFPKVPIWMLTEVMSLGKLSRLYYGLPNDLKTTIADDFNVKRQALESWLHSLSIIRNICAHHSRLWNRQIPTDKGFSKNSKWEFSEIIDNKKLFSQILKILNLLETCDDKQKIINKLLALISPIISNKQYQNYMGFPNNWRNHPLIKN